MRLALRRHHRLRLPCSLLLKQFSVLEREAAKPLSLLMESKPLWGILVHNAQRSGSWTSDDEDSDSGNPKASNLTKSTYTGPPKRVSWRTDSSGGQLRNDLVFYHKNDIPDFQAPWSVAYMRSVTRAVEEPFAGELEFDSGDLAEFALCVCSNSDPRGEIEAATDQSPVEANLPKLGAAAPDVQSTSAVAALGW